MQPHEAWGRTAATHKEMFNSFLTFSAADGHWNELHKLLPGHERYLGKRIVKSLDDVEESERDNCITELEDWFLRKQLLMRTKILLMSFSRKG